MRPWIAGLVVSALLVSPITAGAGEAFYLLMFGAQRVPANPNYAHSFAAFVRASWVGDDPCPVKPTLEVTTISWLPVTGSVRTVKLFAEPGRSYELHETIRWCQCNDMRVSMWGAYQISPYLYCRAVRQANILASGQVRYKADDSFRDDARVVNCIHALAKVVEGPRLVVISPGWGESASYFILKEYEQYADINATHPWVGSALGLDQYPIIYRDYTNPRSNAVTGPLYRLLGGERNLQATYGPPVR